MCKKILIISISVFIAVSGFLTGFFSVGVISVYAINDDDLWQPLNSENELVDAFQYYCKSRDLTIEGSVADAVTTATTGAFNGICNKLGIDITALQADIKKSTDSMGNIQFLFDSNGITAYNRIFAQFLQDNELSVGDSANQINNTIYSGEMFSDNDGNTCFVTLYRSGTGDNIIQLGTPYKYTGKELSTLTRSNSYSYTDTLHINNSDYILASTFDYQYSKAYCFLNIQYSGRFSISNGASSYSDVIDNSYGFLSVGKIGTSYYLGWYVPSGNGDINYNRFNERISINGNNPVNVFVFLNTNNTVINNNNYEGDTIINNEGDVINNPAPEPTPEPNDPNDTIHNVPETPLSPNPDGGWDIDLPDIDIPNLPIGNLSEKFPFSIPWDLVAFYAMLDAEPQAPRFNGTMDLTLVQWNYDIDLAPFDSAAELCRKLQFGLFVVGLIVASRSIIRG